MMRTTKEKIVGPFRVETWEGWPITLRVVHDRYPENWRISLDEAKDLRYALNEIISHVESEDAKENRG